MISAEPFAARRDRVRRQFRLLEPLLQRDGLGTIPQCVLFLLLLIAFISRRPEMFAHAQFYAEDGKFWYAQAYNLHWLHSLLIQEGGYLNSLPRLIAGLTLLVPFRLAPLVMNCAGLVIQALPVTALLSARCRTWGTLGMRMLMAAIYVLTPDGLEIHVVLTNAQWHLLLLELLLAFGAVPATSLGKLVDLAVFGVGAVSGPFPILLVPFTLYVWWKRRQGWTAVLLLIEGLGAAIQILTLIREPRSMPEPLGASLPLLLQILGRGVVLSGIFGPHHFIHRLPTAAVLLSVVLAGALVGYTLIRGTENLKLLLLFSALLLAVSLRAPRTAGTEQLWPFLLGDLICRYWFYPLLALAWSALWCAMRAKFFPARIAGWCLVAALFAGGLQGWRYPRMADKQFAYYVVRFAQARPGEHVVIPIFPDWQMELIKHAQ